MEIFTKKVRLKKGPKMVTVSAEKTKGKPKFDLGNAVNDAGTKCGIDGSGALQEVPSNWSGEFASLNVVNFSNKVLYFQWKAVIADQVAEKHQQRAADYRQRAEDVRTGKVSSSAKLKRFEKMKAQMEALEQELKAQGIEI